MVSEALLKPLDRFQRLNPLCFAALIADKETVTAFHPPHFQESSNGLAPRQLDTYRKLQPNFLLAL